MTDIKLPPSRSPAMDKVEQRAWELLEAECGKPLPFDVPTHAALSAIRAALAQQPAAVNGAAVDRVAAALLEEATNEPWTVAGVEYEGPDRDYYRKLARKVLALTTQHQEPTT